MLVCWLLAGPKDITFGKDGIRKELLSRATKVAYSAAKGS
jgi:hypothetical protein